jgi:hypothetical protein
MIKLVDILNEILSENDPKKRKQAKNLKDQVVVYTQMKIQKILYLLNLKLKKILLIL